MSAKRDIALYLNEIVENIALIQQYPQGVTRQDFDHRPDLQAAVIRWLEVIGEASSQLPADWKAGHAAIPWNVISGMRNHLIHGYFTIDRDQVWNTIQNDIGLLAQRLLAIRAAEFP